MKRSNKIAFGILGVVGTILLVLLAAGFIAKQKIKAGIQTELGEKLTFEELDVEIFRRRMSFEKANLQLDAVNIHADEILLKEINYYKILFGNEIRIGTIEIENPEITFREKQDKTEDTTKQESALQQEISIGSLSMVNGRIKSVRKDRDREELSFLIRDLVLTDVEIDSVSLEEKIPFRYTSYAFALDSVEFAMNEEHDLFVETVSSEDKNLQLEKIRIIPKYDKVEFQKHIPYQKDRFELDLKTVQMRDFEWSFVEDSLLLSSSQLTIQDADIEIYRNKLIPEDTRGKPLYSEKLRKSPVKLHFPRIVVRSSGLVYEEQTAAARPPGKLYFTEVEADIQNLTNVGMGKDDFPVTVIHAEALFHGQSPVELDWEFDVSDTGEEFLVSGRLTGITEEGINAFVRPALNVESRGGIDSFAFNFAGNNIDAVGDVETRYEDFKIIILKDDGSSKNSFWSAIANLFISNDAVTDNIKHSDLTVTRNQTKSFWNFLWLLVREGALSAFL